MGRILGPTEHDILATLREVVHDLEWAGAVPAANRLRVGAVNVTLVDPRVDHRRPAAVHRQPALAVQLRVSVNIDAVKDDLRRHVAQFAAVVG